MYFQQLSVRLDKIDIIWREYVKFLSPTDKHVEIVVIIMVQAAGCTVGRITDPSKQSHKSTIHPDKGKQLMQSEQERTCCTTREPFLVIVMD